MQKLWGGMSSFCKRCWGLPLAALLGWGVLVGLMMAAHLWSWRMEYTLWSSVLEWLLLVVACLVLILWLGLVGWLLVRTVQGVMRRMWWHVAGCWGCTMLSGALALLLGLSLMILTAFFPDRFAHGLTLPEGREFVSPRGLRELQGDVKPASDRARELLNLRPRREPPLHQVALPPLPNLERLTAEAPEILQEYVLRCLYAEAVNPRFDAPVLALWQDEVMLGHADDPQTYALYTSEREKKEWRDAREVERAELPEWQWKRALHNGWSLVLHFKAFYSPSAPEPPGGGCMLALDDSLKELAANPTREYLDSILPPVPPGPFLCLWSTAGDDGVYKAVVILPADYPEGCISLSAREVTTGKPIGRWKELPLKRLGSVCSVAVDASVLVEPGNWNEFYASTWEIWFHPAADGANPRCVGSQDFLMMGWQH